MQDNNKDQNCDKEGSSDSWRTPGIVLRKARRQKNLSEDEVCRELGFRIGVLKALESDDLERLPTDVYVRGYIRSYCSLLEIDEQPVLDSYTNYCQQVKNAENGDSAPLERKAALPWWKKPLAWLIVGVVLTVLTALWWLSR
ncbi:helix-turn-helix domain-containing protein [bacterium SCSIO 12696]|nr:helix-turn-helix domain-containing protein [bacterium SCSIO 12696]